MTQFVEIRFHGRAPRRPMVTLVPSLSLRAARRCSEAAADAARGVAVSSGILNVMSEESTTPDLVELTRRMFEVPAGTWSPGAVADRFTSFCAPDVVWDSVGLGTTFNGLAASREFVGDWVARFEDYEIDVEEILDLGNGVVFVKSGHVGRPVGSPGHIRLPREVLVHALVWEQGMVTRVVSSGDTPEARAAAERLAEERG